MSLPLLEKVVLFDSTVVTIDVEPNYPKKELTTKTELKQFFTEKGYTSLPTEKSALEVLYKEYKLQNPTEFPEINNLITF